VKTRSNSLKNRFKELSVRWSLIGLFLTIIVIVPTIFILTRHSSERQVEVMATALARAFRPMVIQDNLRDAQLQMEEVAKLKSGEAVAIFNPNWEPSIKGVVGEKETPHCVAPESPCWIGGTVSIALPIFFDEQKSELYGYLVLNLRPSVDWFSVILVIFCGGLVFFFQVRVVYLALRKESLHIESVLNEWKNRIDDPTSPEISGRDRRLFSEFLPLDDSVQGLHEEIERLKTAAATQAKIEIVRGIGHDLKTPLSQAAKFLALLVMNSERNGTVDKREVSRIEAVFTRMGALIRQVTNLGGSQEAPTTLNLSRWVEDYCNEFKSDPTVLGGEIEILAKVESDVVVSTAEMGLFRIVDNLVRNGIEALPEVGRRRITVAVESTPDIVLRVTDTGGGIPEEVRSKMFDLGFTTKRARETGLGLGIVKKISDELGLRIEIETVMGRGTSFCIQFPAPGTVSRLINERAEEKIV
jgi:signal transduction histidine kinase